MADPRIAEAYRYKQETDTASVLAIYGELGGMGFSSNSIKDAIARYERLQNPADANVEQYEQESRFDREDLFTAAQKATATGDVSDVAVIYDELIETSEAQDPAATIRSAVGAEFKADYVKYVNEGDAYTADSLASVLTGQFGYTADELNKWVRDDKTERLNEALAVGDVDEANAMLAGKRELGQEDSSIAASITRQYKPLVIEAYYSGDADEYTRIAELLFSLRLMDSDNRPYYSMKRIQEWVKNPS
jgi:hypothetical protein